MVYGNTKQNILVNLRKATWQVTSNLKILSCWLYFEWMGVYLPISKTLTTAGHFHTSLLMHIKWPKTRLLALALTFESSARKRSQAAGTSPHWRVCMRWALKVGGSRGLASPGGTRLVSLGPSEPEVGIPCGGHRRSVSSCDGPGARVLSGSSHSWDSWPSPHSSASRRSAPQGRWVLQ